MRGAQKVVWSEGLLMAPQHLQQQDRYHEALLCDRLDALHPFSWGVLQVDVDKKALSAGQLQIAAFRGILPDGTALIFDAEHPDETAPNRVIAEHFPATQRALDVFLGIPVEREGADNFSERSPARYFANRKRVHDMAGTASAAEVAFARRRPVVLFGDEPRTGVVCIKVAEIVRDDSGGLVVSEPYIPPCLRVDASQFLMAALRRLLNTLVTRHTALSEARREASKSMVEFGPKDITRFLLLSSINEHIPILSHIVDSGYMSPERCYLLLLQLGGQLTTFSVDIKPMHFPGFVYTDLRGTFEELFARLISLLRATIDEHYVAIELQSRPDGMYTATLQEDRLWSCSKFFVVIKTDMPEQPTATQVPRLGKVASWSEINTILSAATPGAALEVTYRPPPEIPVKAGLVYFGVATENAYWRSIASERNIAVYLPPLFDVSKTQVQLMGVLGAGPTANPPR